MNELKYKACTRVIFRIAAEELEGTIDSAVTGLGDQPNEYSIETDDYVMYHVDECDIVRAVESEALIKVEMTIESDPTDDPTK